MKDKKVVVVDGETASAEFYRFAEEFDLDLDLASMSDEDAAGAKEQHDKVLRAISAGALVFDENCLPEYTPTRSEDKTPIKFSEPTGATLQAMDRRKKGEDMGKTIAALAQLTGEPPVRFSKMAMRDFKVCTALFVLLGD